MTRKGRIARVIATWFGAGLAHRAPGTWGSLATLPLGILTLWLGGPWATAAAGLAATVIGLWAVEVYLQTAALKDPKEVVIDEVAGQLFALVPAGLDWRPVDHRLHPLPLLRHHENRADRLGRTPAARLRRG